jgi:hypothetical protein
VIGLTKQEKTVLFFLLWTAALGGGVLIAKHRWPHFAQELVISPQKGSK